MNLTRPKINTELIERELAGVKAELSVCAKHVDLLFGKNVIFPSNEQALNNVYRKAREAALAAEVFSKALGKPEETVKEFTALAKYYDDHLKTSSWFLEMERESQTQRVALVAELRDGALVQP